MSRSAHRRRIALSRPRLANPFLGLSLQLAFSPISTSRRAGRSDRSLEVILQLRAGLLESETSRMGARSYSAISGNASRNIADLKSSFDRPFAHGSTENVIRRNQANAFTTPQREHFPSLGPVTRYRRGSPKATDCPSRSPNRERGHNGEGDFLRHVE
jgi:hypothetical protein